MSDVLYYQNYAPAADVSTLAICMIYWLLLRSTYTIKQTNLTILKTATVLVSAAAVSNIFYHQFMEGLSYNNIVFVYLLGDILYLSLALTYIVFCLYVRNLVSMDKKHRKYLDFTLWPAFVIYTYLQICSPFTKFGFHIDENLHIHQNFYYDPFQFIYFYYSVVIICLFSRYKKRFINKMYLCIRNVMIVSFVVMALQSYFHQTSYLCITFTFPIMAVLFLFHYNSYTMTAGHWIFTHLTPTFRILKTNRFPFSAFIWKASILPKCSHFQKNFISSTRNFSGIPAASACRTKNW